jgi:peptidoglycan/LPS O-acetylase OafA/YrhL
MRWSYRPALDGLRTLAVYLVVLYHVGIGPVAGGFVGVDLFFVLSGFLVSTILLQELEETGRLDLVNFYDRRIRRLLPAAIVVVLASCNMAVVMLSTVRRLPLVGDAQAALLYVANWRFLAQSNDYFGATDVGSSLFLHFWSLSIEEQFYFFFPILLLGLRRLERRRRGITVLVLAGLFAASLAAQLLWAATDPTHAYYGTEARLYQLLAGSLLALAFRRRYRTALTRRALSALSVVSLAGLLVTASSLIQASPSQRGLLATVFSLGLVGTLAVGSPTFPVRLFSRPSLVYLGKISYGTYLWHWPVLVLLRAVIEPSLPVRTLVVIVLSTGLASASYQVLERPIRSRRIAIRLRKPVVALGLLTSTMAALLVVPSLLHRDSRPQLVATGAAIAGTVKNTQGAVPRIDYAAVKADVGSPEWKCGPDDAERCAVVTGQPGPKVMLVGDSHGQMLVRALTAMAEEQGFNLYLSVLSGCPWQEGLVKAENRDVRQLTCAGTRDRLYHQMLDELDIDIVMLSGRSREDGGTMNLVRPPDDDRPVDSRDALIVETTERTFASLDEAGVRTLVFTGIWEPTSGEDPLECLAGARSVAQCRVPVIPRQRLLDSLFVAADAASPDIYTVDINPIMCPAAPVCDPVLDGIPVWRDSAHYSPAVIYHQRAEVAAAIRATGVFDGLE